MPAVSESLTNWSNDTVRNLKIVVSLSSVAVANGLHWLPHFPFQ
jgi:hypothetical protein